MCDGQKRSSVDVMHHYREIIENKNFRSDHSYVHAVTCSENQVVLAQL